MRLKLVSDGTPHGTKIVHAATGEPVEGVKDYQLEHAGPGVQSLRIEVWVEQPTGGAEEKDPAKLTGEEKLRRLPSGV